jgi:2-polyprenyl-6-methoxyphenol hydroxylase-like FAD-dependent oxidoreductase
VSGGLDADVLVVGAGPVGLATAIRAREAGHDVLVIDRRAGVLDKACGEGLLPGALRAVQALGVDPPGHPLAGISYRATGRHAEHLFAAGPGRGVRRTALHAAMQDRAHDAGIPVVRAGLRELRQDAAEVHAVIDGEPRPLRARWLLGCDGLHSTVRRLAGLGAPPRAAGGGARYGLRRHYRVPPWTDLVEVHWSPDLEAYVTPVADDVVGVALLGPVGSLRTGRQTSEHHTENDTENPDAFGSTLERHFPELAARVLDAAPAGPVRGAGPLRQRARRRTAGRVRLVGDASGYVDALTGEGVRVGLAQAEAVVTHLDDPAAYERAWRRVTRDYRALTSGLLAWAGGPARGAIVPTAHAWPWLYGAVVERLAR